MRKKIIKPAELILNNQIINEKTEGFALLVFLYTNRVGRMLCKILKQRFVSKLYGMYQNSQFSKHTIAKFVRNHAINLDDFEIPHGGYQSFNDFFIRKLKAGKRPIDTTAKLISPADSKLLVIPKVSLHTTFFVKKLNFNLETFLQNTELAKEFAEGTMLIFRLAPYDYHRFHCPATGIAQVPRIISGAFDSVNPVSYKAGHQPLLSNERHIITLRPPAPGPCMLIIPVGAMLVGKIIETYNPQTSINQGDEMGYFAFGGSTVVLLLKQGEYLIKRKFIENSHQGYETIVKMGEAITE